MYVIPHVIVLFASQVFIFKKNFFCLAGCCECCCLWLLNLLAHIVLFPVARWCCCDHHYHITIQWSKKKTTNTVNYIVTDVCVKPQLIKQHTCTHTHTLSPKTKKTCHHVAFTLQLYIDRQTERDNKTIIKTKTTMLL